MSEVRAYHKLDCNEQYCITCTLPVSNLPPYCALEPPILAECREVEARQSLIVARAKYLIKSIAQQFPTSAEVKAEQLPISAEVNNHHELDHTGWYCVKCNIPYHLLPIPSYCTLAAQLPTLAEVESLVQGKRNSPQNCNCVTLLNGHHEGCTFKLSSSD